MSDRAAVLMALVAAAGALVARPVTWPLAAFVVAVALFTGDRSCCSSAWHWPPRATRPARGRVWLRPCRAPSGSTCGSGTAASRRGPGDGRPLDCDPGWQASGVAVVDHLEALSPSDRAFAAPRHVSGRLTVEQAGDWSTGDVLSRVANSIRRTLLDGAYSLSPAERSLFAGFVLGDDRDQPPEVAFDFRATGLTHLLVVSGGNVAFVLALAGPALGRLSLRSRLVVGALILGLFGTRTRWEPSVLRAVAMAGITLLAGAVGRPASTLRVLALAVSALLVIDPLLVHSIGFRLSVGACVGIALVSGRLAARIPGPRPLAEAVAVTLAAQTGVAPVMVPIFGGLPVVTLLSNVLALPVAGALMGWGVADGLVAGIVGGIPAAVVHLPTRLMVGWVAGVARLTASLPFGHVGAAHPGRARPGRAGRPGVGGTR